MREVGRSEQIFFCLMSAFDYNNLIMKTCCLQCVILQGYLIHIAKVYDAEVNIKQWKSVFEELLWKN